MRKITMVVIFCFLVFSLLLGGNVEALIFIDLPADITGIGVERTTEDDDNDDDVWELADAQKVFFVEVTNELRRYVGVYIDRIIQGQGVTPINNGENDEFISPVSEVFSYDFLSEFFWGDTPSSSRNYFLPVPDDLGPGDEALFRVKVVGPAWLGTIPFDLSGPNAPPESAQLIEATAYTLFETIVVPLIQLIVPSVDGDDLPALLEDFKQFVVLNSVKFHVMVEQGDYSAIMWEVQKWMANSTVVRNMATSVIGGQGLVEALGQLGDFLEQPLQIAEWFNVMLHLAGADWLTQVDVNLVYPKIESLDPAEGQAGDLITIRGKGFDPYDTENNTVYFTEIDELNGLPLTTLEADVVEVSAEDTIVVQVPEGFYPGSVRVVVDDFKSNDNLLFDEPFPSELIIDTPSAGDTVRGDVQISVTLTDPPDPFPMSQARLLVDGDEVMQIDDVLSPNFNFIFDSTTVAAGLHTFTVELTIDGHTVADSVDVTVEDVGTGTYLVVHSPIVSGALFAKNEPIRVQVEVVNGPEPILYDSGGYADFRLFMDGVLVSSRRNDIGTVTYPGCYSATLAYLDLDMVEGSHTIRVEANSSSLQAGDDYNLMEEFVVTVGPPVGDPNTIDLRGEMCHFNMDLLLTRKDATGYLPFDVTFLLGYCCEPFLPHLRPMYYDEWVWPRFGVEAGEINEFGQFADLRGCSGGHPAMESVYRVHGDESTGWDIVTEGDWGDGPYSAPCGILSGHPETVKRSTHVRVSIKSTWLSRWMGEHPPQCPLP